MAVNPAQVDEVVDAGAARLSHAQLRDGLRASRSAAFTQLYEEHAARIYNLCLRILGSPEDAQDVTQEVFLKAHRSLPGCAEDLRVEAWLYRVAVNACYDLLRARKVRPVTEVLPAEMSATRIDAFEQAELVALLEQTLAHLSLRQRTALLFKDLCGLTHAEIGAILGISWGASEMLLFHAREAFRHTYAALAGPASHHGCNLARQAAVASVGGELSTLERHRVSEHAKHCPECRRTVATWGIGALGLGAFLRAAPLPAALGTPPFAAAAGAGAGTAAATAASAPPVMALVGAGVAAKGALLAIAASTLLIAGGVAVHQLTTTARPAVATDVVAARTVGTGAARALGSAGGTRGADACGSASAARAAGHEHARAARLGHQGRAHVHIRSVAAQGRSHAEVAHSTGNAAASGKGDTARGLERAAAPSTATTRGQGIAGSSAQNLGQPKSSTAKGKQVTQTTRSARALKLTTAR